MPYHQTRYHVSFCGGLQGFQVAYVVCLPSNMDDMFVMVVVGMLSAA